MRSKTGAFALCGAAFAFGAGAGCGGGAGRAGRPGQAPAAAARRPPGKASRDAAEAAAQVRVAAEVGDGPAGGRLLVTRRRESSAASSVPGSFPGRIVTVRIRCLRDR